MSTALAPSVTTRDPKGLKFVSVVEDAYNKAKLSDEEAQCVNDTSGLAELVGKFIAESRRPNKFRKEEVSSNSKYPKGYKGPKPISEQIEVLAKIFGLSLGLASKFVEKTLPTLTLPDGAEGWFAIPRWEKLGSSYGEAVDKVLTMIASKRKFYSYREGQFTPDRFRLNARTAHALDLLAEQQKGDILIVGGQFGKRHAGKSVRRAREVMVGPEFGAHTVAAGSILLTHPERLVSHEDLWFDVPGDEFDPGAGGSFDFAPFFVFLDGRVKFDSFWVYFPYEHYGSVSLFLPQ